MKKFLLFLALLFSSFLISCEKEVIPVIFSCDIQEISAVGKIDGKITITVSSGTPPYVFSCTSSNFSWTSSENKTLTNTTGIFNNLNFGSYFIKVIDSKQQSASKSVTLIEPQILVEFVVYTKSVTNRGGSDGSITIKITSGVSPYTYILNSNNKVNSSIDSCSFNDLKAGLYSVQVIDSKQQSSSKNDVQVKQPEVALNFTCTLIPVSIYGFSDGSIKVNVTSGIPPYTYKLNDTLTNTSGTFSNLFAGKYKITVIDDVGQNKTENIEVTSSTNKEKKYYLNSYLDLHKNSNRPPDTLNTKPKDGKIDNISPIFSGNNRFSVSFWYNTKYDYLYDFEPARIRAGLFAVVNNYNSIERWTFARTSYPTSRDKILIVYLTKTGIEYGRYRIGKASSVQEADIIYYNNSEIWKGYHHIVITYNGVKQRLYVDNILQGELDSSISINTNEVYLRDDGNDFYYTGEITKLYIYNEALTKEDVNKLFNNIEP